ncbi:hypothetical protein [Cellulomonas wangsupingiae]|uniref:PIN domain-containing protein n=1 Tax=Cellulomonas wangsupingiae TaxID=2968085 RepID=A0ABY5KA20_9CELL|nr:hypothetical protein [Cellulomonas wangsupingiae]MCC2334781.1 hypothetical protein [Cellulomonas wangsupingiae]UUI66266.1 hypothetical protein NP075_05990 [Cellulomonas wangsupingiae]
MTAHLLDTHVLLWLPGDPERVAPDVRTRLADPVVDLLVSAASALEVATKQRLGSLGAGELVDTWGRRVAEIGAAAGRPGGRGERDARHAGRRDRCVRPGAGAGVVMRASSVCP